jgi:hypothetical protein
MVRAACVVALVAVAAAAAAGGTVDVREARAQPCTRAGVATSVMAYFGLLEERRFPATRLLWLPRPRLQYAYVVYVHANGQVLRARRGAELPGLSQRWMAAGGPLTEVVAVDVRINRREPLNNGYAVWWIRKADDGTELVLGSGKGVWDCERRQIGRLVGSERTVESEEGARVEAAGHCGRRGSTPIRRYGQTAALCGPARE